MVSQHALQVSRPTLTGGGEAEGSGQGASPGPHPRWKLRGLAEGSLQVHTQEGLQACTLGGLQAHTWGSPGPHLGGGVSRPTTRECIPACTEADCPLPMATAWGSMYPTGMHSCFWLI